MIPVPTHLRSIAHPMDSAIDENPLKAKILCSCGNDSFEIKYPGQTHERNGESIPCTAEIDGKFFFLIAAFCSSCKIDHLLIDQDFHGWNGFVCHEKEQSILPRPALKEWKCSSCNCRGHKVIVSIQSEGKEDYLEECDEDMNPERWIDAFGWFSMDIKCTSCEKETKEWVSLETM